VIGLDWAKLDFEKRSRQSAQSAVSGGFGF